MDEERSQAQHAEHLREVARWKADHARAMPVSTDLGQEEPVSTGLGQEEEPSWLTARREQPSYAPDTDSDGSKVQFCQACIPPTTVSGYRLCTAPFSMSARRHHCRYCGLVICSSCSTVVPVDRWLEKAGQHRLCETDGRRQYEVIEPSGQPDPMGGQRVPQRLCRCCAQHAPAEMDARDAARQQRRLAVQKSRQRQSAFQPAGRSGVMWKQDDSMGMDDWTVVFVELHGCMLRIYNTERYTGPDDDDTGVAHRRTGPAIAIADLNGATVGPPKTARPGKPHCWRLQKRRGQATWRTGGTPGRRKLILAALNSERPWGEWFSAATRMRPVPPRNV